jgi:hypothetical protein
MVDTTIYGWVLEGEIICAKCADLNYWSPGIQRLLGEDGPKPIYSIDDNEVNGTTCDAYGASSDCTGWVFEPVCGECYKAESDEGAGLEYDDAADQHVCRECREKGDES